MEENKALKKTRFAKFIPYIIIVLLAACLIWLCIVVKGNTASRMNSMGYRVLFDREITGSEVVKAAEERDYDIIVLTREQTEGAGDSIAPFVTEDCLVVFENMTIEQVRNATGLAEGIEDVAGKNASVGLMMKDGTLRVCGFESKKGLLDKLTNENVADAAADLLSHNR